MNEKPGVRLEARPRRRTPLALALCLALALRGVGSAGDTRGPEVQFSRDIQPVLSDNCFRCHGPDGKNRKAGLRLDSRDGLFADLGGERVVVPGKPEESELFRRISAADPADRMPPPDSGKSLSATEIERIRLWIELGASWQGHWSFVPPTRPVLPPVRHVDGVRNEIDRFVIARLEAEGLAPSPEADRRTLIRRVTLDLTGLPPTLQEVRSFVNDPAPDAYERLVDRLLASPAHGEHMARYWLDAARYGDTHGLHLDNMRTMWPYRDWVIDALNRNMPFDRFTIEQLAGDLLPDPTLDQRIATGFNRCNVTTSEGGAIDEEFYVRYAVDRVETTATVWMGLTAGCAACHSHKFDPISQKEFYQLFAYFNNIAEPAMDGNRARVPPFVEVPLPHVSRKRDELQKEIAALQKRREARARAMEPEFRNWLVKASAAAGEKAEEPAGLVAHLTLDRVAEGVRNAARPESAARLHGKALAVPGKFGDALRIDGNRVELVGPGDFERDQPFSYGAWIQTPGNITGAPLAKMDTGNRFRGWDLYIVKRRVAMHLIHRWSDLALKVTTKEDVLEPGTWHHVFVTHDGSGRAAGVKLFVDGKARDVDVNNDSLGENTTRNEVPLTIGQRRSDSPFTGGLVDDVRVYDRCLGDEEVGRLAGHDPIGALLALAPAERSPEQNRTLLSHYLKSFDGEYRELSRKIEELEKRDDALAKQVAATLVMEEREERRQAYVLYRGEYDQRRDPVEPGTPAALPDPPQGVPPNRLGLARWLVDPSHPLTARVTVNRLWQQKFGTGIVKTSEDFGRQGDPPSHPELLDWLATEFVGLGWDMKRLQRLIVTSATYRQSSRASPGLIARDPANRLLARGPRYRLDAEMLRDQALAVSGLLVRVIGGPSVKPPQPDGLWYAVGYTSSNTARFKPDTGEDIYRRGVYTFWKRTAPPPQMTTFDAPSRESCSVRRERTNTPLQALLLLNEEQYVEAARHLAQRVLRDVPGSREERLALMFEIATARRPDAEDLDDLLSAQADFLASYREEPDAAQALIRVGSTPPDPAIDPVELAAWTLVGNLILNLDEAINKN